MTFNFAYICFVTFMWLYKYHASVTRSQKKDSIAPRINGNMTRNSPFMLQLRTRRWIMWWKTFINMYVDSSIICSHFSCKNVMWKNSFYRHINSPRKTTLLGNVKQVKLFWKEINTNRELHWRNCVWSSLHIHRKELKVKFCSKWTPLKQSGAN